MGVNISEIETLPEDFADELEGEVLAETQKISLQLLTGVVMKTAVDTGRARANWQAGAGSDPGEQVIDDTDKGGSATINRGTSTIEGLAPWTVFYLVNNLPYIVPLEEGSSDQAPAGMVEVTIQEIDSQFGS